MHNPTNNGSYDILNEDLEAHHHHQQHAGMCNAPLQWSTSITDTMPNYDMEPPCQLFALSPFEQPSYATFENDPQSFASTTTEFYNNLFGANLGTREVVVAYM